jgi:hypothetical protein
MQGAQFARANTKSADESCISIRSFGVNCAHFNPFVRSIRITHNTIQSIPPVFMLVPPDFLKALIRIAPSRLKSSSFDLH